MHTHAKMQRQNNVMYLRETRQAGAAGKHKSTKKPKEIG
jgi:hypothetical protein